MVHPVLKILEEKKLAAPIDIQAGDLVVVCIQCECIMEIYRNDQIIYEKEHTCGERREHENSTQGKL